MNDTHDLLRLLTNDELATPDNAKLLYEICANEDMAALRYLVEERHLSVKGKSFVSGEALEGAATAGSLEMIEYLVQRGADVNQTSAGGYYGPLINAARSDKPLAVLHLLDCGADPGISTDTTEELLFNMLPYPDVLKRVLEAGADPDFESIEYDTPLDACCFGGYENGKWEAAGVRIDTSMTESMQVLLEGGASPYLTLAYSCHTKLPDTPIGRMYREVLDKARRECTPTIEMYLEMRKPVASPFSTLLALIQHYEAQGADLFSPAPWRGGYGLLQYAVERGSEESVDYLLSKGLTWETDADYFASAFESCSKAMVQRLLREGLTPLHPGRMWHIINVFWRFDEELLWIPLEQGWMPEPKADGETVLHALACRSSQPQSLELFKAYVERMGLNPTAEDDYGYTPYDIAKAYHFQALTDYLDRK